MLDLRDLIIDRIEEATSLTNRELFKGSSIDSELDSSRSTFRQFAALKKKEK